MDQRQILPETVYRKSDDTTVQICHNFPGFPDESDKILRWEEIAGKLRQLLTETKEKQVLP